MAFGDLVRRMNPNAPAAPSSVPAKITPHSQPILGDNFVTSQIQVSDRRPAKSRVGGTDGYTHVTSLIGACAREHVLSENYGLPVHEGATGSMKMVWAIGRAVEKHIRDAVIDARGKQGVYGRWRCLCGTCQYDGEYRDELFCKRCTTKIQYYMEPALRHDVSRVVGSPDLTLIELGHVVPIEIKSMNEDQYDALKGPLADHCLQVSSYNWLYRELGFKTHDQSVVVYGRKKHAKGGTTAIYKEFKVNFRQWEEQVIQMMQTGATIATHKDANILPARVCDTITCPRATRCKRAAVCFAL